MNVHIHAPAPVNRKKIVHDCPTCGKPTDFLAEYFKWYGPSLTCLECGDAWGDGERLPRPFAPGWRKKRIEAAKARLAKGEIG